MHRPHDIKCPVCGHNEWDADYMRTADGEMRVDTCVECGWPPSSPHSVPEWRAHYEQEKASEQNTDRSQS